MLASEKSRIHRTRNNKKLFNCHSGGKGLQNSVDNSLNGKSNGAAVREFLWQHIELAQSKGFDDNVGRNPPLAVFEVSKVVKLQYFQILSLLL